MLKTLKQLVVETSFVQAVIAISLVAACISLWVRGMNIPDGLSTFTGIAVGFYFGIQIKLV